MNNLGERKRFLLSLADSLGPLTRSGGQSEHRIRFILPPSSELAKENKMKYYLGGDLRKHFVAKRLVTYNNINHAGGLRLTLPVLKQLLYLQFQNSQHTKS